jgi:uncharacterized membrane protein
MTLTTIWTTLASIARTQTPSRKCFFTTSPCFKRFFFTNHHLPNRSAYRTSFGIIIGISSFCLLLIFAEIGLAAAHKLKPTFHLVSSVLKALIAVIYFIVVCIGSASVGRGYGLDIILSLALMLSTVIQVIYGSVLVHRVRKGVYNNSGSGAYGPVAYKGQGAGDVELQAGQAPVYR